VEAKFTNRTTDTNKKSSSFALEIPGQSVPLEVRDNNNNAIAYVKIDEAYCLGDFAVITGWTVGLDTEVQCQLRDQLVLAEHSMTRDDVSSAYPNYSPPKAFMLIIAGEHASLGAEIVYEAKDITGSFSIRLAPWSLDQALKHAYAEQIFRAIGNVIKVGSSSWDDYLAAIPALATADKRPSAFLETAVYSDVSGIALIVGWSMASESMWVEDDQGNAHAIKSIYRTRRPDVESQHGDEVKPNLIKPGLIAAIELDAMPQSLTLWAINDGVKVVLGQCSVNYMGPSPERAAQWLFSIAAPMADMSKRIEAIDEPFIAPLLSAWNNDLKKVIPEVCDYGVLSAQPLVSVVVPLYARHDFMEYQLMAFADDDWFKQYVELIYVVDDPRLIERVKNDSETFELLYQVPYRVVYSEVNRGFSGANNIGAKHSKANHLLFLNSDVFPKDKGWLQPLLKSLNDNPNFGAVGPVLEYGDGSIQHAGMDYKYRRDIGVWVNYHPKAGLDTSSVMGQGLREAKAITGACVLISRRLYKIIDGWCEDYLIGDFEDSDLCFKIQSKGLALGVDTNVALTHLERQSFTDLGTPEYRTKVVIYNAVKHQNKWHQGDSVDEQ